MKKHIEYNIPPEHLHNGCTNTKVTIRAKYIATVLFTPLFEIEFASMPSHLIENIKNPRKLNLLIEARVREEYLEMEGKNLCLPGSSVG